MEENRIFRLSAALLPSDFMLLKERAAEGPDPIELESNDTREQLCGRASWFLERRSRRAGASVALDRPLRGSVVLGGIRRNPGRPSDWGSVRGKVAARDTGGVGVGVLYSPSDTRC